MSDAYEEDDSWFDSDIDIVEDDNIEIQPTQRSESTPSFGSLTPPKKERTGTPKPETDDPLEELNSSTVLNVPQPTQKGSSSPPPPRNKPLRSQQTTLGEKGVYNPNEDNDVDSVELSEKKYTTTNKTPPPPPPPASGGSIGNVSHKGTKKRKPTRSDFEPDEEDSEHDNDESLNNNRYDDDYTNDSHNDDYDDYENFDDDTDEEENYFGGENDDGDGESGKKESGNGSFFSKVFPGKKEQLSKEEIKSLNKENSFTFTKEKQVKIFRIAIWTVLGFVLFAGLRQIIAPPQFPVGEVVGEVSQAVGVSGFPVDSGVIVGREFLELYLTTPQTAEEEKSRQFNMEQLMSPNVSYEDFKTTTPPITEEIQQQNTVEGVFRNPYLQVVSKTPSLLLPPVNVDSQGWVRLTICNVVAEGVCRALLTFSTEVSNPNLTVVDPANSEKTKPKPPELLTFSVPMIAVHSPERGTSVAIDGPLGLIPNPEPVTEAPPLGILGDSVAVETLEPELLGFFEAWAASNSEKMKRYIIQGRTTPTLTEGLKGKVVLNTSANNPNSSRSSNGSPVSNVKVNALPEERVGSTVRLASATVDWLDPVTMISFKQTYTFSVTQDAEGRWYVLSIAGGQFR